MNGNYSALNMYKNMSDEKLIKLNILKTVCEFLTSKYFRLFKDVDVERYLEEEKYEDLGSVWNLDCFVGIKRNIAHMIIYKCLDSEKIDFFLMNFEDEFGEIFKSYAFLDIF